MNIILTFDPHWNFKPASHTPFWGSLDNVHQVAEMLEEVGNTVALVKTDDQFKSSLTKSSAELSNPLVFWLNEFLPAEFSMGRFTAEVVEKLGMMHTGPDTRTLAAGLDKEATKNVIRKLGFQTPDSCVIFPGDYSPIEMCTDWDCYLFIKPLRQGHSTGIDEYSVVFSSNYDSIKQKVETIHRQHCEPALIEKYIGGIETKELSVPVLISYGGKVFNLPIINIDFSKIPPAAGNFSFLTGAFKQEKRATCMTIHEKDYLQIPSILDSLTEKRIISEVAQIVQTMGCKDMARVDIRLDGEDLYYLEVNANPGKNKYSYLMMSSYYMGLDYLQVIAWIPYQAMLRYGIKPPKKMAKYVEPVAALFRDKSESIGLQLD